MTYSPNFSYYSRTRSTVKQEAHPKTTDQNWHTRTYIYRERDHSLWHWSIMYCGMSNLALSDGKTLSWNSSPAACAGSPSPSATRSGAQVDWQ